MFVVVVVARRRVWPRLDTARREVDSERMQVVDDDAAQADDGAHGVGDALVLEEDAVAHDVDAIAAVRVEQRHVARVDIPFAIKRRIADPERIAHLNSA